MGGRKRRDVGGGRVGGEGKLRERWKLGAAHTGVCGGGVAPSAKGGAAGCVGPSRRAAVAAKGAAADGGAVGASLRVGGRAGGHVRGQLAPAGGLCSLH